MPLDVMLWVVMLSPAEPKDLVLEKGPLVQEVVLPGALSASQSEQLLAPRTNSWQVQLKWLEEEGLEVEAGHVVARFDDSGMLDELTTTEQEIISIIQTMRSDQAKFQNDIKEAELAKLKARIEWDKAKIDASVPKHLQEARVFQEFQLEELRAEKVFKEAADKLSLIKMKAVDQGKIAERKLQGKKDDLALLKKRIKKLELKAKNSGLVVHANHLWERRKLQANDTIQAGWAVVEIPQMDTLFIEAWATEFEREQIHPGQSVKIVLDAHKDRSFSGTVQFIESMAKKRRNWGETPLFAVGIDLQDVDASLMRPGMSAQSKITIASISDTWKIPLEAVVFDQGSYWVKAKGQNPQKVTVIGKNEFHIAIRPMEQWETGQTFDYAPFAIDRGEP